MREIEDVIVTSLLLVEPARDGLSLKIGLFREQLCECPRINHQDLGDARESTGELLAKGLRHGRTARADQGDGAWARQERPLAARERDVGKAARKRHCHGLQDSGLVFGECNEVHPRELEDDGVAECSDGRSALAISEESDLADRRAATDFS